MTQGVSGPNALISGRSFSPPVTKEQLDKHTFNIVPNRDIIAMLDDVSDHFERLQYTAPTNDIFGCHFKTRSLCEIIYTCGTKNRPAICECHRDYGYPKPEGDKAAFDAACLATEEL